MALFVMLNLFTWLKSKVNTHSFKIKLGETTLCSDVYVQGLILRRELSYIIFCFVNLGRLDFFFFNLGLSFGNLAILLLVAFNMLLGSTVFSSGFLSDLGKWRMDERNCRNFSLFRLLPELGVLRGQKTGGSSANKWSLQWLKYSSSEFKSFKRDDNTEHPGSINLARCSSGMKLVGGREKEPNEVLIGFYSSCKVGERRMEREGLYFCKCKPPL